MKNFKNVFHASLIVLTAVSCSPKWVEPNAAKSEAELPPSNVNIRTFDEMNETMAALTGLNVSEVADSYNRNNGGGYRMELPTSNVLAEFNSSHQGAIVRMASDYCNLYVNRMSNGSLSFVDGGNFPANLTDFNTRRPAIVDGFYDNFWGACKNKPDRAQVHSEVQGLLDHLVGELSGTTSLNNPSNYLKITCTTFLASSCVTMF